jgi:hypothetical protein
MAKIILKYKLDLQKPLQMVELPKGAEIMTATFQPGSGAVMWALCPKGTKAKPVETETRCLEFLSTGKAIQSPKGLTRRFIATLQGMSQTKELEPKALAWHVFERTDGVTK